MVKCDRKPLKYVLMYYKPIDKWMVYNFSIDEKIDEGLETFLKTSFTTTKE